MGRRLRKPFRFRLRIKLSTRFYNGGERENGILTRAYDAVAKHVHTVFKVSYRVRDWKVQLISQARIPYGSVQLMVTFSK
jgi:hypothetical protein